MSKIFISFLGTSSYSKVTYVYDDGETKIKTCTRFVQVALVNSLCSDWGPQDRIIVFRTLRSNVDNWLNSSRNDNHGLREDLTKLLAAKNIPIETLNPGEDQDTNKYIIPEGFDEQQLWMIFSKLYDTISKENEIYFDMTHAFRTIPLFATVLFNYCRSMKGTVVKSIHYGAYESINQNIDRDTLGKMSDEDKAALEAPLINLNSVVKLQAINEAVTSALQFGEMGSTIAILGAEHQERELGFIIDDVVRNIKDQLESLYFYTQTADIHKLRTGSFFATIKNQIDYLNEQTSTQHDPIRRPVHELINRIYDELIDCGFVPMNSDSNIHAAINWTCKKNMVQQSVTVATEYIKESFAKLYRAEFNEELDKDTISGLLSQKKVRYAGRKRMMADGTAITQGMYIPYIPGKSVDYVINAYLPNQLKFINWPSVVEITTPYDRIRNLRNNFNHAKGVEGLQITTITALKEYFMSNWNQCLQILKKYQIN